MLIQPFRGVAPLALRAPDIPGRTEQPLPSGELGINRAAARDNFPLKGLKVFIPAWYNMDKGDTVELHYDSGRVDQHTITEDVEVNERVTLWLPPGRITSGAHTLSYTVTRVGQAPEPYTPPVKTYIKLELPGGQDINPEPGEHSELYQYIDPAIVADGVDKDSAKEGVKVIIKAKDSEPSKLPYPDCAVGDVITLSWGGVLVKSEPVTQAQIDDPDSNPISVHVSEKDIIEAGDSGPEGLAVTFTVHDLVQNAAEDWCTETRIIVDTGNSRLEAPILDQADGNILNLDKLNEEELLLSVWAASADFMQNDVIIMYIRGTTEGGEPVERKVRQTISKKPPTVVEVLLPNSAARALAKTQALFFYELERGGEVIQRSKGRFINIIGEPYRLAAPIAKDAVGGALHPDQKPIRIHILYDERIEEGMAIELKWLGTRADLTTYEPELDWFFPSAAEARDPAGFTISVNDNVHLKTLEGGTLDLSYNLLSDEDGVIVTQASLHAELLTVGEPKLELVPPILLGEKDGALEPDDLPNGTSKITCPNPVANPTRTKDVITRQLRDANGALLDEDSKTLNSLNAGKPVDFPLDAAFVQKHFEARRGETLSISYTILRFETGKTSYSNPLVFVVGEAVELVPPTIDLVKGSPSDVEIPNGGTTVDTTVTLSGAGAKGQKVQIKDGDTDKGEVTVDLTTGLWEMIVTGLSLGDHIFTAIARYGSEQVSLPRTLQVKQPIDRVFRLHRLVNTNTGTEIIKESTVPPFTGKLTLTVTVSERSPMPETLQCKVIRSRQPATTPIPLLIPAGATQGTVDLQILSFAHESINIVSVTDTSSVIGQWLFYSMNP